MLVNSAGGIFAGVRIDSDKGYWQMPQGGIDDGEAPCAAAFRELYEETGISSDLVELLGESLHWRDYDIPLDLASRLWGGRYCGQRQRWFLFGFLGDDSDVRLDLHTPEFSGWGWRDLDSLVDLIVPFKRDIYRSVVDEFRPLILSYVSSR